MFIVLEVKTTKDDKVSAIAKSFAERAAAESRYHTILAAAATSDVAKHACLLIDDRGMVLRSECYEHPAEEA